MGSRKERTLLAEEFMNIFRIMPLQWHAIWTVFYLLVYVVMIGSGYMSHHVVFIGQQTLAFIAGGTVSSLAARVWKY